MMIGEWGFRATYNIVRTSQLPWTRDLNQKLVNTTPYDQSLRPYPNWQGLSFAANGGNAIYQSLMFQLTHQWKAGLFAQLSYQFRKDAEDIGRDFWSDQATAGGVTNSYNRRYDWGRSGYVPSHDVMLNWVWELPVGKGKRFWSDLSNRGVGGKIAQTLFGNWASTGTINVHSGDWFTVQYSGFDTGNVNSFGGRPNRVPGCDPMAGRQAGAYKVWFNKACFTIPANGHLGDEPRMSLSGPTQQIIMFSPYKDFRLPWLSETTKLRLGANIYNLFNSPNYVNPVTNITSASAGQLTSLGNVRVPYGDQGGMRMMMLRFAIEF
jgi:hypothetical protein